MCCDEEELFLQCFQYQQGRRGDLLLEGIFDRREIAPSQEEKKEEEKEEEEEEEEEEEDEEDKLLVVQPSFSPCYCLPAY